VHAQGNGAHVADARIVLKENHEDATCSSGQRRGY
jgi:hypothetical protein